MVERTPIWVCRFTDLKDRDFGLLIEEMRVFLAGRLSERTIAGLERAKAQAGPVAVLRQRTQNQSYWPRSGGFGRGGRASEPLQSKW
jgi:hypothetical protein